MNCTVDKSAGRRGIVRTPLDGPIGLLLLMVAVSLWATFDVSFSLPKVIALLLGVAVFYAIVAYIRDAKHLVHVLIVHFSLGTVVAALALIGTKWLFKNPLLSDIARQLPQLVVGLPGADEGFHPNEVAGVLLWFVPLQLAMLAWSWQQERMLTWAGIALWLSTVLTTSTLILTQSRGGWLGLAISMMVMAISVDRRVRIGVLPLSAALLALVGSQGSAWVREILFGDAIARVVGELSLDFRVQVWRAAVWGIQDFPLTGMGLGTFRLVARALYPMAIPPEFDIAHAHNGFLQAGVDFGVPGLVAYASIWILASWLVVVSVREARAWMRALAVGLCGCLVSYFVFNVTDTIALGAIPGPAWWMLLGLVVSVFRLVKAH